MISRPCCICGEMFTPLSKMAVCRTICYRPECIKARKNEYYGQSVRRHSPDEYVIRRSLRLDKPKEYVKCPLCGYRRMPSHYTYCCDHCREAAGRVDGDYKYVSMEV